MPDLLPVLRDGLTARGVSFGRPLLARHGRVKLAEAVGERLGSRVVIHLLGERPGGDATSSRSLSAYVCFRVPEAELRDAAAFSGHAGIRHETTVISNIYENGGLPPLEAAAVIVEKVAQILEHGAAGNRLEARLTEAQRG